MQRTVKDLFPRQAEWMDATADLARGFWKVRDIFDRITRYADRVGIPEEELDYHLRDTWRKVDQICGRLALLSHALGYLCSGDDEGADKERVGAARVLADRADRRTERSSATNDDRRLESALEWIRAQPRSRSGDIVVTAHDLQRDRVAGVKLADERA